MPRACPCCQQPLPADALFCIACGASVRPSAPHLPARQPSATGPTIRLPAISLALSGSSGSAPAARPKTAAHAAIWWCVRGTVSMLFSIGFVIGLAHYLTMAWSHPLGWWPVVVVVSGALVALRAWVRGASGPGVAGMLAWGGLTWLLVLDRAWPAGSLLLLGWAIAMYRNR